MNRFIILGEPDGTCLSRTFSRVNEQVKYGGIFLPQIGGVSLVNDALVVTPQGNVGIGVAEPDPQARLHVNGNIMVEGAFCATKIMCRGNLNECEWPDYVFDDAYSLMPLKELADYVKTEKHLPGIPSAQKIVRDGMDMQDMNIRLLTKIEELHLYILELEKRIDTLENN